VKLARRILRPELAAAALAALKDAFTAPFSSRSDGDAPDAETLLQARDIR
jgi:hypothetical protein